jgi:hypothetical protein
MLYFPNRARELWCILFAALLMVIAGTPACA